MSKLQSGTNQTLDRAYKLVMELAGTNVPMSVMEISKALGITRTTAYTMINSLMEQHFLERNPATKKYTLGYRFYQIGGLYHYQFPFLSTAEKYINPMYDKWQMRINVTVIKPEAVGVILLSKDPSLFPHMPRGHVVSANATAGGKLMMAYQPPEIIDSWFKVVNFPRFTPATITDKDELRKEFVLIRKQGYSTEIEELSPHRACIGAPVRNMAGEVIAAVSCAGSLDQVRENHEELTKDIIQLGSDISEDLGYNLFLKSNP